MNKKLVAYFSAGGVTKKVAEKIKEIINGDLFEIEPKIKYTEEDLDWTNNESRSSIEMSKKIKPPILKKVDNINEYDTIILGFPVWWYTAPTIINQFIEENNLDNKKIYVFVTSGGSEVQKSFNDLKNTYTNLNFISGRRLSNNITEEEIKEWIK